MCSKMCFALFMQTDFLEISRVFDVSVIDFNSAGGGRGF